MATKIPGFCCFKMLFFFSGHFFVTHNQQNKFFYILDQGCPMQANRNLGQEKAPIYRLSRSKAPKTQQIFHYKHRSKTSELFLLFNTGVDFSLRNNFANSGSFAKVSVPVHNYNSLFKCPSYVGVVTLYYSPVECHNSIWVHRLIVSPQWSTRCNTRLILFIAHYPCEN